MTGLSISIVEKGKVFANEYFKGPINKVAQIDKVFIEQNGTVNGNPVAYLCSKDLDSGVTVQCSTGNLLDGIASAVRGVRDRKVITPEHELINSAILTGKALGMLDAGKVSDGYHSFDELYDHRIELYITLCRVVNQYDIAWEAPGANSIWRSQLHSDGSSYEGWFLLGILKAAGHQMSYHLPMSRWEDCDFAETLDKAPDFDGHTPADVLTRLKSL